MFWVLKYACCNFYVLLTTVSLLLGGMWLYAPLTYLLVVLVLGDRIFGEQLKDPPEANALFYDISLWLCLPQLIFLTFLVVWYVSPSNWFGFDGFLSFFFQQRTTKFSSGLSLYYVFPLTLSVAFAYGMAGTNVAHELIHRTWSKFWVRTGRILLGFTSDTSFEIEHVWGHHNRIATPLDPASAPRGKTFYSFFVRSLIEGNLSAFRLESEKLRKRKKSFWSVKNNRLLAGWLISAFWYLLFSAAGGLFGFVIFAMCSLGGKVLLELINYIEHYGLVRQPGEKVEARHSWNCNQSMSLYHLYNLPRHSHHHAAGHRPFWRLKSDMVAPTLPYGYLTMIVIALFPKRFFKLMNPMVKDWDQRFATKAELALIASANDSNGSDDFKNYRLEADQICYDEVS